VVAESPVFDTLPQVRTIRRVDENTVEQLRKTVDDVYRTESRCVFATLIRMLGDFDLGAFRRFSSL